MKKIKIFIFIILFSWFYTSLASNTPLWYWWNTFTKNNKINNTKYELPLWYIWNNFNKKVSYTWILNQTPIWFFADYKWKIKKIPKLNKIIYNFENTSIVNNNTWSIDNESILKEKTKQDNLIKLKERIKLAKNNWEIYTYRLREYIKNNDGTFTNIDTLNPYTWNIKNLKKKIRIIPEVKNISIKKEVINDSTKVINSQNNIINTTIKKISTTNSDIIKSNEILAKKIDDDIKIKQELQIKRDLKIRKKIQDKQDKINNLENRIRLAKNNWEIYTYRLREYIKNTDSSFINIDTLRPYTWNIERLEKKNDKISKVEAKIKKKRVYKKKKPKKTTNLNIINKVNKKDSNKKEIFKLESKQLLYDMLYIYWIKQLLVKIKNSDYSKYIVLQSCFTWNKCDNIDYYNKIKEDINNSINIIYLSKRLNINIESIKSLNYKDMLQIILKVFWKEKYFNLNISKIEYSDNVNKLLWNIIKGEKLSSNKVDFKSYKRIYFSLLESPNFINKLEKTLFNN